VAAAVAVVAAVGGGAYGVGQLMSGGESAASAVPADAIAYASVDLDPSAAQKLEAVKIFRKFPGLRSELKISSRDDLRKTAVDQLVKESGCRGVDFDTDVKPWIGNRLAVAAVPGGDSGVLPLLVLQVTDEDKARQGVRTLERCDSSGDAVGVAFVGDYMLLSEKKSQVDAMAKEAESAALADDADYTTWMDRAGDPGIVTMYASKDAPAAIIKQQADDRADAEGEDQQISPGESKQLETAFRDFEGAAGVVRFKGGAVEAEFSTKGLYQGVGADSATGPDVTTLPGTTAAVLSVAFKDGWLERYLDTVEDLPGGSSMDGMMSQGETMLGLRLPEDIETLLGDGFSLSVDSTADLEAIDESPDPAEIPAGIRIKGDAAAITAIIEKLKAAAGPQADLVQVRSKDGIVAVGTDKDYVASLLEKGDLGDTDAFTKVVPEPGRANGVFFVSFDAGDGWAERLADLLSDGDPDVKENVKPLDALGTSSWQDEAGVQHSLVRLTTD
jgi:hypothetical protein